MTFQVVNHRVLRAVQAVLKTMLGGALDTDRQAKNVSRPEALWREMTSAGDLLIDALRLEQEFSKINLTHAEDEVLERWKAYRETVEHMSLNYASAVSQWRESFLISAGVEPDDSARWLGPFDPSACKNRFWTRL